jgi:hypothetical protein
MSVKRFTIIFLAVLLVSLPVAFIGGAFAYRDCLFPFCRGMTDKLKKDPFPQMFDVHPDWKLLRTSQHQVIADRIDLPAESKLGQRGGDIASLGTGLLIMSNLGDLSFLDAAQQLHAVEGKVPVERSDFDFDNRDNFDPTTYYGAKDILTVETDGE